MSAATSGLWKHTTLFSIRAHIPRGQFVLGFVFGPLAILNAGRAEAMNVPATFGKVAGWIVTVLSFGSLILIIGAAVIGIIGANS